MRSKRPRSHGSRRVLRTLLTMRRPISSRVGCHVRLDDLVRVLHRLAALDLVDVLHPGGHLAPDRVLVVEDDASSKQMKNWLSPESGLAARAIDVVPRTCGSLLNSALSFLPEPPVPVPCGHPVCAMKPSMTRWNTMPS